MSGFRRQELQWAAGWRKDIWPFLIYSEELEKNHHEHTSLRTCEIIRKGNGNVCRVGAVG